jgi:hypothetical protein
MSRCEKRRLTQFKNNLKISSVHDVPVKEKGVRSLKALHNPNFKKRICELRKEDKKNFQ